MTFMMKYWETDDWTERYAFAQRQAITGLVFGEIEKSATNNSNIPKQLLFQWLGDAERIKQQNFRINREVEALGRLLDGNGVRYAVVKGQVVATYYERPELRSSGDVDFFVPSEDVEKAQMLISKEWNVEMEKGDSPYHFHFEHNGITFEMHFRLFLFYQKRKIEYWEYVLHQAIGYKVTIGSTNVATIEPTVHALYVFLHLYHHLVEVGVGLRQFYDLAMLMKEDIDRGGLMKHVKALGMEKAFRACGYILTEYLGMDKKYLPFEINASDKKYGRRMLDVILYRGNMGHYNKKNGWSGIGHQVESACIKIAHFAKFFWLSPGYHLGWMKERLVFHR